MEGNLNNYIVGDLPTLIYVPNFITEAEESQLLTNIYEAPISKWKSLKNRRLQNWGGVVHEKGLLSQDLPHWLSRITGKVYEESGLFPSAINHVLINEYLPDQGIMPHQDGPAYFPVVAILSLGSPVVMEFTPHSKLTSSTDTCNGNVEEISDRVAFEMKTNKQMDSHRPYSVLLMPRSLLIFKDTAYSDYLHGIKDCEVQQYDGAVNQSEAFTYQKLDQSSSGSEEAKELTEVGDLKVIHRTTKRVSLTCRLVLKVHRNLFKF